MMHNMHIIGTWTQTGSIMVVMSSTVMDEAVTLSTSMITTLTPRSISTW